MRSMDLHLYTFVILQIRPKPPYNMNFNEIARKVNESEMVQLNDALNNDSDSVYCVNLNATVFNLDWVCF